MKIRTRSGFNLVIPRALLGVYKPHIYHNAKGWWVLSGSMLQGPFNNIRRVP
jgi:hypothetical protein